MKQSLSAGYFENGVVLIGNDIIRDIILLSFCTICLVGDSIELITIYVHIAYRCYRGSKQFYVFPFTRKRIDGVIICYEMQQIFA